MKDYSQFDRERGAQVASAANDFIAPYLFQKFFDKDLVHDLSEFLNSVFSFEIFVECVGHNEYTISFATTAGGMFVLELKIA